MFNHAVLMSDIHRDLIGGDSTFPSSVQLAVAIRQALDQEDVSTHELTRLISAEPLLAAKLVRLANCVTFNPSGQPIFDIQQAIARVGFNAVRSVALATAIAQLKAAPTVPHFIQQAQTAWQRCVQLAALSRLLAKAQKGCHPDEAMLCGLVSEIGVFYLLSRAGAYADYVQSAAATQDLLLQYGESVTVRFLSRLGLPGNIVQAIASPDLPDIHPAKTLRSILCEARRLGQLPTPVPADEPQAEWLSDVQNQIQELRQALLV